MTVRRVAPARLSGIEPTKVSEVLPAILRGEVRPDVALDYAASLSKSDLREKYAPARIAQHGQKPDDSVPIDASTEPVRVQCKACGEYERRRHISRLWRQPN